MFFFFQMFFPPVAETSFHTFMFVVKPSSFEGLHIIHKLPNLKLRTTLFEGWETWEVIGERLV